MKVFLSCVLVIGFFTQIESFSSTRAFSTIPGWMIQTPERTHGKLVGSAASSDDEGESISNSDRVLLASLMQRHSELQTKSDELVHRWRNATCKSTIGVNLPDWVRRIDMSRWPFVACGSAKGGIYVVDCRDGAILASLESVHTPVAMRKLGRTYVEAMQYMFGEFDGGGTLALGIRGDIVVSVGREGGAKMFKIQTLSGKDSSSSDRSVGNKNSNEEEKPAQPQTQELVPLGEVESLKGSLCTSLALVEQDKMWIGCYDGSLHRISLSRASEDSGIDHTKLPMSVHLDSHILCLDVSDDINLVACGTTNGSVHLISTIDGATLGVWHPFQEKEGKSLNNKGGYVRAVKIVEGPDEDSWAIACGTGDGRMFARQLLVDGIIEDIPLDDRYPLTEFSPRHRAAVTSLATHRQGNLLVTGAQDGTMRVWNCWGETEKDSVEDSQSDPYDDYSDYSLQPKALYSFAGYKVWLGSVCVDEEGKRLISDGSDNACIIHDFSVPTED